ncbi:DUF4381 domain-containing protein [Colwellia sp. MEBiC06753]
MDPLAQLKDIHLPEQVNNYPIAPGWWLLLAIVLVSLIALVRFYLRFRKARKIRNTLMQSVQDAESPSQISELLKIALLNYFPRQHTAQLHGASLKQFLISSLPMKKQTVFDQQLGDKLEYLYQPSAELDTNGFKQSIHFWLKNALPPSKAALKNLTYGGQND